jgi:NitT/TauT family transport system substrate-binding protein
MRARLTLLAAAALLAAPAIAQDKITFATNWKAQAAHGGFYQAVADGTYKKYGLDVTIQPGGPQVNNRPLLPAGRIDFLMTGNLLHSFDNVKNKVPTVVVAAMFQKDPQALMAHPGQGYEKFEALKNAPLALIAKDGQFSWWQWLKVTHGFKDERSSPTTTTWVRSWPTTSPSSRATRWPSRSMWRTRASSSRWCTCWPTMGSAPTAP